MRCHVCTGCIREEERTTMPYKDPEAHRAMTTANAPIDLDAFASARARFWSKVVCVSSISDTCWHWLARKNQHGYGTTTVGGRRFLAHRAAWILTYGSIDHTLTLDHLCRNRACVNPAHLEQVSLRSNILRGESVSAVYAKRTHCKHGHGYTPKNTRIDPTTGGRRCRICEHRRVTESNARKRVHNA